MSTPSLLQTGGPKSQPPANGALVSLPVLQPLADVIRNRSDEKLRHPYPLEELGPGGVRFSNVQEAQRLFFAEREAREAFIKLSDQIKTSKPVTVDGVLEVSLKLAEAGRKDLALELLKKVLEDVIGSKAGKAFTGAQEVYMYKGETLVAVQGIEKVLQQG